jgi:tetratricopeptide (TPR) repeat protein
MIMGESLRIAERYEEAIEEYKAATEHQPHLAPAWAGLAASYSASGDEENALKAAAQALALDPNDPDTNVLVAGTYLHKGDYAKARPYAVRALEIQPKLSSAHVVLAKIELAEHRPEKALPELEAAVKDDTDGSTYYLLGTTLRELGKREDAAAAMQKYKQLHSMHVAAAPVRR